MPNAYIDRIFSSKPSKRVWCFSISCGSKAAVAVPWHFDRHLAGFAFQCLPALAIARVAAAVCRLLRASDSPGDGSAHRPAYAPPVPSSAPSPARPDRSGCPSLRRDQLVDQFFSDCHSVLLSSSLREPRLHNLFYTLVFPGDRCILNTACRASPSESSQASSSSIGISTSFCPAPSPSSWRSRSSFKAFWSQRSKS